MVDVTVQVQKSSKQDIFIIISINERTLDISGTGVSQQICIRFSRTGGCLRVFALFSSAFQTLKNQNIGKCTSIS